MLASQCLALVTSIYIYIMEVWQMLASQCLALVTSIYIYKWRRGRCLPLNVLH